MRCSACIFLWEFTVKVKKEFTNGEFVCIIITQVNMGMHRIRLPVSERISMS